jgi:hypothetical protein
MPPALIVRFRWHKVRHTEILGELGNWRKQLKSNNLRWRNIIVTRRG